MTQTFLLTAGKDPEVVEERRKLERDLGELRRQAASGGGASPAQLAEDVAGIKFVGRLLDNVPARDLKPIADDLKPAHDLIVGAWRFAESAVDTRYAAVRSGNVSTAWQASSSAAGAMLFIDKAQRELRGLLQPPQLQ